MIKRDDITHEVAEQMARECIVTEELSDYATTKLGQIPREISMFLSDKDYLVMPYFIAKKYGYKPINPCWSQRFFRNNESIIEPSFTGKFRPLQVDWVKKIIKFLDDTGSCVVGLPPGYGKTIIGAFLINLYLLLGCVVCKQTKVKDGWINTFKKVLPNAKVWVVGENDHKYKCVINDVETYSGFDIILCMMERVKKIPDSIKIQVGTLLIDEVHTVATNGQKTTFLGFAPKYVIFESATFKASTFWKLAAVCSGEHGVFKVSDIPHYVFAVKTGMTGTYSSKNGNIISSSVHKDLLQNKMRMNIALSIIYNHAAYRKIISLQRLTQSIEDFKQAIKDLGISADSLYGSANQYTQSQVIVGTVQKMGTGFDEENACSDFGKIPIKSNTLLIMNSILSEYLYYQCVGRVMRTLDEVPAIIYLIDENPTIQNHFNKTRKFIKECNGTIIYVDYRDKFIPMKTIRYQHDFCPLTFFRILSNDEYKDLFEYGIFIGNIEEQKHGYIILQSTDMVNYYLEKTFNKRKCYVLELQQCNLFKNSDGTLVQQNGILFCKHSIFKKNIVNVTKYK